MQISQYDEPHSFLGILQFKKIETLADQISFLPSTSVHRLISRESFSSEFSIQID